MSGTLFVVATPIGNLEDITFRALRVLREVDVIAAEDTRRTAKLLTHYGISTPAVSFHQHNTRSRLPHLIRRLEQNEHIALVTDAGTPGVSDPGVELVDACLQRGIPVDPVPGPSASLAAATASGFPMDPLTIFGFVPTKAKDRKAWLAQIQGIRHTFTCFEAPHRIRKTLSELGRLLGTRQISVAREISKVHQQFLRADAASILGRITELRGEFTIVVGPCDDSGAQQSLVTDLEIFCEFRHMPQIGPSSRRQVVAELARKHGRSPREVYAIIERLKSSGI
ncbi:MAG: 16S rRNA (cytidine(1402)-2'-O)-methyltransferase [Vicinamibacterales bacterium]